MRRAALALLVLLCALAAPGAAEGAQAPWQAAAQLRTQLFDAQSELILGTPASAAAAVGKASGTYRAGLAGPLADAEPAADRAVRAALARAAAAARAGDDIALGAARGAAQAAVHHGTFEAALAATAAGNASAARDWLLVREFRTATRFTRPGADATLAVAGLQPGEDTAAARQAVAKDLLDAYQARLRELLDDIAAAQDRDLPVKAATAAAQAAGSFDILADRYAEDRGADAARATRETFAALVAAAVAGDARPLATARTDAVAALEGFTAAPLTDDEAARRAQQLLQFLALVPVEYGRGVSDGQVTKDFEIQEAVAFFDGAEAAFADLSDALAKRDATAMTGARAGLAELGGHIDAATRTPDDVADLGPVEDVTEQVERDLRAAMPAAWEEPTDESDYDLIALTLDRMEAAAGAGQYQQAEQARLEAYAFFEFGPERRLQAFNQGLALDVEGLIWFGTRDQPGLATLIADRAPRREIRENRLALDELLADSAATLGDSANRTTVVTNSAIIVFREGLEGVLILAAITASMVGARRRLRRPVMIGAALGLVASLVTWALAQTLLGSLEQYGEKLEAVVGLIAIGVLLLITNWFFHKVYWSEWIAKFHKQRRRLEQLEDRKITFISAQAMGLVVLGLTSVYREGFETVLFLQSLQLSAGTTTVVLGAGLGLGLTLLVAFATFRLQHKLPYKRMLVVTGVLIGFVLVVMVGQTARTMQGTGWIPINTLDVDLPYWAGLWFGVYPSVETIGAQIGAIVFVLGSYVLAREVQVKGKQRRHRKQTAAEAGASAELEHA